LIAVLVVGSRRRDTEEEQSFGMVLYCAGETALAFQLT
jgi:hypothetical protein